MNRKKISFKSKYILSALGIILIIIAIVHIDKFFSAQLNKYDSYILTQNCTVYKNDTFLFDGDVKNLNQSEFKKGDLINVIINIKEIDIDNAVIFFESQNDKIRVYLDEKLMYSFGKYSSKSEIQGYPRIKVGLGDDYNGKTLRVEIKVNDSSIVNNIQPITLMNAKEAEISFISSNVYILVTGFFLLISGIFGGLFVICGYGLDNKYRKMIWLSSMGIMSSIWIIDSFNILEYWCKNYRINYILEYESLYLLLMSALNYAYYSFKSNFGKLLMKILYVVTLIYIITVNILQINQAIYLSKYLYVFHIIALISLIGIIIGAIIDGKKSEKESFVMLWAFGIALCASGVYVVTKYVSRTLSTYSVGCIAIALLIFLTVNFMGFVNEKAKIYMSETERQYLLQLAYVDQLTGIGNRRACEKCLKELEDSEDSVTIFSYDLNGLKKVNDNYGHSKGDEFIKSFTAILKNMDQTIFVGRLGGDEFISVISSTTNPKLEEYINDLKNKVDNKNKNISDIKISYAYGYEVYDKTKMNIQDCLFSADENMYINKEEYHMKNK